MKKKKRSTKAEAGMAMPRMPSPMQQMRSAAEYMAETAMRTDPAMKKRRNAIVDAVMQATKSARGSMAHG